MSTENLKERTLTLHRTFDAPISLVWEAWTNPEHIINWWGPAGTNCRVIMHEFKVGGQWKYAMDIPNMGEFITEGIYSEIVPHQRIISSADFRPMTEGVEIQAIFKADGDQTQFTFNVVHATVEYCRQQEEMGFYNGWASTFDRLKEFVE